MSFRINTDSAGMQGANALSRLQQGLDNSIGRMGSGDRIQKAADDAAGLTISNSLLSQAGGLGQSMRNASDAVSIAQVAEGGLSGVSATLLGIRENILQAGNGSHSSESLGAIQTNISQAIIGMDNISGSTQFNNQSLLSGSFTNKSFQVGSMPGQTVNFSIDSVDSGSLGHPDLGTVADIDVTSAEGREAALGIVDAALDQVNANRANLGSVHNEMDSRITSMATGEIQALNAASTIKDVDIAEESMNMSRMKNLLTGSLFAQAQNQTNQERIFALLMPDMAL